jgi:hypothetical protein
MRLAASATHWSQMKTFGPATSLATLDSSLPQQFFAAINRSDSWSRVSTETEGAIRVGSIVLLDVTMLVTPCSGFLPGNTR